MKKNKVFLIGQDKKVGDFFYENKFAKEYDSNTKSIVGFQDISNFLVKEEGNK